MIRNRGTNFFVSGEECFISEKINLDSPGINGICAQQFRRAYCFYVKLPTFGLHRALFRTGAEVFVHVFSKRINLQID